MTGYREIRSQSDLDKMFRETRIVCNVIAKEFHFINRASVDGRGALTCDFQFDAQLFLQVNNDPPLVVELVLSNVRRFLVRHAGDYNCGVGSFVAASGRDAQQSVELDFDGQFQVSATRVFYALRPGWTGPRARLGFEVPSVDALSARALEGRWRQCSHCSDAWEESADVRYSLCPACESLTELVAEPR